MKIYDISQNLRVGMPVWPGDQDFQFRWTMRLNQGDSYNVSTVTMSAHTGTHVDAPLHFDDSGPGVAALDLTPYLGPVRVMALRANAAITASDLIKEEWRNVARVLFKTRPDDAPELQFDRSFAYLSEDCAGFLGERGLLLVGTDSPSVDAFGSLTFDAHKILQKHRVAILEGVRLAHVPEGDYELICLPLKLEGLDGSPVRAILRR
jgi:arylformamidase